MKKIYIFFTIAFSFLIISSTKIFAHSPYHHVNVFDLSTQTVNFGDSNYYILRSPYRDVTDFDFIRYTFSGNNLIYNSIGDTVFSTGDLSNGQFNYTSISSHIYNRLNHFINNNLVYIGDGYSTSLIRTNIEYTLDIDYTSSVPFNFILSYSGTTHNNGWNSPINDKVYGLKLQFYGQVNDDDNLFVYISVYSYDVNGNQVSALMFPYYQGNTFNLGIAIKLDTTPVDTARIEGYNDGYYNGRLSGITEGSAIGYNQGKKDYGYNDNGTIITGDSAFGKGYTKGSNDNMPNFFVLMTDGVFTAVSSIGNIEVLPNLKISYIAGIILALGLVKFITGRKGDD